MAGTIFSRVCDARIVQPDITIPAFDALATERAFASMPFARTKLPMPRGPELERAMRITGMPLGRGELRRGISSDIELVLAAVAREALPHDYRLLGVLTAWLEVHHVRVNVPRLGRIIRKANVDELRRAWWAAVGQWLGTKDVRWRALVRLY